MSLGFVLYDPHLKWAYFAAAPVVPARPIKPAAGKVPELESVPAERIQKDQVPVELSKLVEPETVMPLALAATHILLFGLTGILYLVQQQPLLNGPSRLPFAIVFLADLPISAVARYRSS